jgi:hypothetical protein
MNLSTPLTFCKRRHAGRNAALVLFSTVVLAQSMSSRPIKKGLWQTQTTQTVQVSLPPEVEARIAAMPAAQQAQVRAMMGGGGGAKPQTSTVKSCEAEDTTPDDLMSQAEQKSGTNCKFTNRQETGNTLSFDVNCSTSQGTASGHSSFVMKDSDHVTGTFHMTMTMSENGGQMNATMDGTSSYNYLGADCGDVKPSGQ